jgi:hypothetical protein
LLRIYFFILVASGLAQAQELREVATHHHGPVSIRHARYDGTAESTNWSGYAVTGANGSVTSVSGSWIIPASTCTKGSAPEYAAFWIGIDGWNSNTVEQIGTDSDCANGEPSYYAWFEFYPEPAYYAGRLTNLTPGHVMSASVTYNAANGEFTASITDLSDPFLTFSTTFTPSRRTGPPSRSSAEWIAEAPSSSTGVLPLADFRSVSLGEDYTPVPNSCFATVSGKSGAIESFGSNVWISTMVNDKTGVPMATPTSLSTDGSSFSVAWNGVGP